MQIRMCHTYAIPTTYISAQHFSNCRCIKYYHFFAFFKYYVSIFSSPLFSPVSLKRYRQRWGRREETSKYFKNEARRTCSMCVCCYVVCVCHLHALTVAPMNPLLRTQGKRRRIEVSEKTLAEMRVRAVHFCGCFHTH